MAKFNKHWTDRTNAAELRGLTFCTQGGNLISLDGGGKILVWDTTKWMPVNPQPKNCDVKISSPPEPFVWRGDRHIVYTSVTEVLVKNLSKRTVKTLKGHKGLPSCITVLEGSNWVVSGGEDKTVCVWDLVDGKLVDQLEHNDWVTCVCVHPLGMLIAAGCRDKSVTVWK